MANVYNLCLVVSFRSSLRCSEQQFVGSLRKQFIPASNVSAQSNIRELQLADLKPVFSRALISTLSAENVIPESQSIDVSTLFELERFKVVRNQISANI